MTKIILLAFLLIITKPIIAQEASNSATKTDDIKGILRQIVNQDNPTSDETSTSDIQLPKAFLAVLLKSTPMKSPLIFKTKTVFFVLTLTPPMPTSKVAPLN